jgi:hypothetical protein
MADGQQRIRGRFMESRSSFIWKARRVLLIIGGVALASPAIDSRLSAFEGPDSVGLDTYHMFLSRSFNTVNPLTI